MRGMNPARDQRRRTKRHDVSPPETRRLADTTDRSSESGQRTWSVLSTSERRKTVQTSLPLVAFRSSSLSCDVSLLWRERRRAGGGGCRHEDERCAGREDGGKWTWVVSGGRGCRREGRRQIERDHDGVRGNAHITTDKTPNMPTRHTTVHGPPKKRKKKRKKKQQPRGLPTCALDVPRAC
eukprot:2730192-Rhodomonas_salina.1